MTRRTRQSIFRFPAPFAVSDIEEMQPPGDYAVEEDDELIEGLSWLAYRRVATFILLPALGKRRGTTRAVRIEPGEIAGAEKIDPETSPGPSEGTGRQR